MEVGPEEGRAGLETTNASNSGEILADQAYLLRLGWSIVRDHALAEDAVQSAFAKLLEQPVGSIRSTRDWLARVVVNECLQAKRRQKVEQRAFDRQPKDVWEKHGPLQRTLDAEQIELLKRSIEQLPPGRQMSSGFACRKAGRSPRSRNE